MTATDQTQPIADLSGMPQPTKLTVRIRNNLPFQLGRFVVLNARMIRMVLSGHEKAH
ncbi:MAG: hypothetical protein V9E83_10340 [Baekduia sp.]|mgnify:CR=1 FL=1